MKKLLIIMTLFMSSFFLFCNKEVKALEFTFSVDSTYFTDYTEVLEKALVMKNKAEDYIKNSDYKYYIVNISAGSNNKLVSNLQVFFLNDISAINGVPDSTTAYKYFTNITIFKLDNNNELYQSSTTTSFYVANSRNNSFLYIFYANFDIPIFDNLIINYNFTDFTYIDSLSTSGKLTPILDIYNSYYNNEDENPHQEEIDKVTNFYSMVIEKIEYLSNEIANNYILLFVIGIFIVIFVFLLIFRRFIC